MKTAIKRITVLFSLASAFSLALYLMFRNTVLSSITISLFTTSYHFIMRLFVGEIYHAVLKNRVDYTKWWFRQRTWEIKFYDKLKVKRWKAKIPTYDPASFDPRRHSWEEIAMATCQAELVHETIMVLSFLPILAVIWLGALPVFLITSVIAAAFDLIFVILQRYNRPRILRLFQQNINRKSRVTGRV